MRRIDGFTHAWIRLGLPRESHPIGFMSLPRRKVVPSAELAHQLRDLPDRELFRLLRRSRLAHRNRKTRQGAPRSMPPPWTREEERLLGMRSDAELARLLGRTVGAVALRRSRRRIPHPNPSARRWSPDERALLGTMPDREIVYQLGIEAKHVLGQRERLKIPVFDRQLHRWTRADDARLGKERDEVLAKAFGVTVTSIKHRRTRLEIFFIQKTPAT